MSSESPASADAPPESFHARALTASLTVKDLAASLAWYQDVMGFAVDQRHEPGGTLVAVSLRAGNVRILLNQDNGARGWDRSKGEGISLQITTDQDVDPYAARIRAAGGTLDSEPADMPWGGRAFRLHDPDGFKFAITSQ
jgi:uncharacterized glyoxalase superfamily protein PhnB